MPEYKSSQIINGKWGEVWINNEKLAMLSKIEVKMTGEFADVKVCGKMATGKKYLGYSGEGSITCYRIDNKFTKSISENMAKGTIPDISIITKLADPNNKTEERCKLGNVIFSEITTGFEDSTEVTLELPFTFEELKWL